MGDEVGGEHFRVGVGNGKRKHKWVVGLQRFPHFDVKFGHAINYYECAQLYLTR